MRGGIMGVPLRTLEYCHFEIWKEIGALRKAASGHGTGRQITESVDDTRTNDCMPASIPKAIPASEIRAV